MRGINHARFVGAVADTRRCRYFYQGRFCESLQWLIESAGAAKNRRGFQRLWLTLVLVFLFIPCNALALTASDMGVVWGPNPVGRWGSGESDEQGVICVADNAFNAALVTCGISTNDERLTADAKAKLSNESSGGNFYTFAQCFSCFQGNDGYDYPSWNRAATGVVDTMANLFGPENVWWGLYESYLLTSAKEDLQTILNGGSLGGGSGSGGQPGGEDGDTVTIGDDVFVKWYGGVKQDDYKYELENKSNESKLVINITNSSVKTWIDNNASGGIIVQSSKRSYGDAAYSYGLIGLVEGVGLYYKRGTDPKQMYIYNANDNIVTVSYRYYSGYTLLNSSNELDINFSGGNTNSKNLASHAMITLSSFGFSGEYLYNRGSNSGGSEEPTPPTNWPESEPTTPKTKPVVPDPPDTTAPTVPTYDPKSYTNPVITTGTGDTYNSTTTNIYNYNYETSDASGQDIIPYLQAILAALNNITRNLATYMLNVQNLINDVIEANDNNASQIVAKLTSIITAINNACTTINSGIGELDTDLNTGLGEIYELIGDFDSDVHKEFKSLKSYLKSLFQWLANQFDFTFDGGDYDDSSILYWLRRIYYKLGAGRVNTRPTDPVADPVGIGDWLAQLFRNFIGALLGIGGDALDAVMDALDDLRSKFPFSIPWDLAAILSLFIAEPIAPQFDVPQYSITNEGLQQVASYHIDLSVFDPYMVGIRTVETLVFAFCLAFKTDFFKGLLTVHKGE